MPKTILIADDNSDIRQTLKDILAEKGYLVELAKDGLEALVCVKEKSVDLLILDLIMPDRSGMEVITSIRSISPHTKIIIYTGFQHYENSVYAKYADKFILKGSDINKLLQAMEEIVK